MKKNLVMGVAQHYDWDTLEPFVLSCKKNCPSAELLLFVDNISDFTREQLVQCGVLIKDFPEKYKGMLVVNSRFKMYSDFLDEYGDNYEQVFLTDTRDVIFQSNVFECFKDYSNYLCYATEDETIRGSKTDYNWIADRFGKKEADKLLDKKIICLGTVIGTTNEIKIFCREIWESVKHHLMINFDQASMNYLVRNNLLPIKNLFESNTDTGEIFTICFFYNTHPVKTFSNKILRGNDGIPSIVHQYTLIELLVDFVDKIYRKKFFQFDERFIDTRSIIEQTTSLVRVNKIGEATRLFMKEYLTNPNFSNCDRTLKRLLEAILKKPFTQTLELLILAVQNAMTAVVRVMTDKDFSVIHKLIKREKEFGYPIEPEFKKYITDFIYQSAKQAFDANRFAHCLYFIGILNELDMPRDKDFYLFVAKVNRLAGKKEAALEAYKKVLELS